MLGPVEQTASVYLLRPKRTHTQARAESAAYRPDQLRIYEGMGSCTVTVTRNDRICGKVVNFLPARHDLARYSAGFSWGYKGAGPSQLALAMLSDALRDDELTLSLVTLFRDEIVSNLSRQHGGWRFNNLQVKHWLAGLVRTGDLYAKS